ncbi:MAG TPA: cystathionine beta-lyase [Devosia sp.]|nr:cystathionine beta-lyase [Devosia sp.]
MASSKRNPLNRETLLTHLGRRPDEQHGLVNTPVSRASTILFPDLETLQERSQPYLYGRTGNPSSRSVEEIVTALEGGKGTRLTPSGLSALSCALTSVLSSGDDVLVTDSAYEPTRKFCDTFLTRMGVSVRYYDPRIGKGISSLLKPHTRAILVESPGSLTFEIQDLPAISSARGQGDIAIIADNTWATPLFYKPLELGADIVVHAGTKMFVGHSDASLGTITANEKYWHQLHETHYQFGLCAAADDCFLAARGLRTLAIRMGEHRPRALEVARWLENHELVKRVLHPALATHPDHALFARDFSGSGSLFSFAIPRAPQAALAALFDGMNLFGIGYSWGGYESLILPVDLSENRTVTAPDKDEQLIRIHIGFEDIEDLKDDLDAGLRRYRSAMG